MQTEVFMQTKKGLNLVILLMLVLPLFFGSFHQASAQSTTPEVIVITLDGPLTPVWSGILQRGIDQAQKRGADLLVIELNTPGGGVELMNKLVQQILASPVPVAVFVSPRGSMAASAGTLLVLAGNIAAMTPESAIGAASPIGSQGENLNSTEELKVKEILKASVRSLAARRGEKAVLLAESAIESAEAATAEEALSAGLIDYVADDLSSLLKQINGQTVKLSGMEVTLNLDGALVTPIETTLIEGILGLLTNPNIVFLLLSVGVQALLIELSNPGGWFAGFVGVVLLSLAIYGLGILPVNWFGLVFLLAAFILFILDIKAPTHGALTAAGTGSFIAGALILFNSASVPAFSNVSVPLVIFMGVLIGGTFLAFVLIAVRAMKTPVVTGRESLEGKTGIAQTEIHPRGEVQVVGERWTAVAAEGESPIPAGARVAVVRVEGVKLIVKHIE
jgi:membrane-bound serine protease (ClpP class)